MWARVVKAKDCGRTPLIKKFILRKFGGDFKSAPNLL
jgi:hypothetical protein